MLRLLAPKTHNSYRKIPFFGEAEEMFLKQKEKTDHLKKALGNRWRATGLLWRESDVLPAYFPMVH